MKKALVVLAVGMLLIGGFSSCKKCTTCEWKQNGTTIVTYPETCGSAQEIDDWKATVNSLYTGTDYEFVCTDK